MLTVIWELINNNYNHIQTTTISVRPDKPLGYRKFGYDLITRLLNNYYIETDQQINSTVYSH